MPAAKPPGPNAGPKRGPVESAVASDLRRLSVDPGPATASLAQLALTLARTLDDGAGMATAAVARELRATLAQLEPDAPADSGALDDLIARLSTPS